MKVDEVLKPGWTGLMYAVNQGHVDLAKLLLDNGADVSYDKGMHTGKWLILKLIFIDHHSCCLTDCGLSNQVVL